MNQQLIIANHYPQFNIHGYFNLGYPLFLENISDSENTTQTSISTLLTGHSELSGQYPYGRVPVRPCIDGAPWSHEMFSHGVDCGVDIAVTFLSRPHASSPGEFQWVSVNDKNEGCLPRRDKNF